MEIFNFLDQNDDNKITQEELFDTLYRYSYDNVASEANRLKEIQILKNFISDIFKEGDANGDGELDFQEFLEIVLDFN
jgi:Ca2+-binding EF-hand superfamily protein